MLYEVTYSNALRFCQIWLDHCLQAQNSSKVWLKTFILFEETRTWICGDISQAAVFSQAIFYVLLSILDDFLLD